MTVSVNPEILKWARTISGHSTNEVAIKLSIEEDRFPSKTCADKSPCTILQRMICYPFFINPAFL